MIRSARATITWRRLDRPGRETGCVERVEDGWRLAGGVVLTEGRFRCRLNYLVDCGDQWATRRCTVEGSVGDTTVAIDVSRDSDARWRVNGAAAPQVDGCEDIDLAFTPMTNLLPIRRLALDVGASASVRAAWLRFPELVLEPLEQTYTRLAPARYLYESAGGAFRRELTVDATGLVLEYPGIWVADDRAASANP